MKQFLILTFSFLQGIVSFAQDDYSCFANQSDYVNNKPTKDYSIVARSWKEYKGVVYGTEIEVKSYKTTEKMKISKLPFQLFTYNKQLYRTYYGGATAVLAIGYYCFYQNTSFSYTLDGKTKNFSSITFNRILKKYDLRDAYKADRPKVNLFKLHESDQLYWKNVLKYARLINDLAYINGKSKEKKKGQK